MKNEISIATSVFDEEIEQLINVKNKLDDNFINLCNKILENKNNLIITGLGKSAIIGKKISSTLTSTGTPCIFMHTSDALHGDLGIVNKNDLVIVISNSGNSPEILKILPSIKQKNAFLVAITGNIDSKLSKNSDLTIDIGVDKEACPMNLAPTSSTTSTLVFGDALAICLMKKRGFSKEDFSYLHPGGYLGKKLLTRVKDVMITPPPIINRDNNIEQVIMEMTEKRLGALCVLNNNNEMIGLITEGDLRRAMLYKNNFFNFKAKDIMNNNFISISGEKKLDFALNLMENRENKISVLPVIEDNILIGLLRIHDIF